MSSEQSSSRCSSSNRVRCSSNDPPLVRARQSSSTFFDSLALDEPPTTNTIPQQTQQQAAGGSHTGRDRTPHHNQQQQQHPPPSIADLVWEALRFEATKLCKEEPILASMLTITVLKQNSFAKAMAHHLADLIETPAISAALWDDLLCEAMTKDKEIVELMVADLRAVLERDPACDSYLLVFMNFKGFHSLSLYRVAHWLWGQGRHHVACAIQSRVSQVFGVDIHPEAQIGRGVLMDHATGIVVGQTAVIGDGCSLLHGVTLGGTGKQRGDRHPKLGKNILVGTGVSILGNITIGDGVKIGACSVVLHSLPAGVTAVGVPARIVGRSVEANPAKAMDNAMIHVVWDYSI